MINFNLKSKYVKINLIKINFTQINQKNNRKKKKVKFTRNINEFDNGKHFLISQYANFCYLPYFNVPDSTMNKTLVESFYNVAIKLTKDFEFTEAQFDYFKNSLNARNVSNKYELIEFLTIEKMKINQNDSRYRMGFRSVYSAIKDNSANISYEYLAQINKMLEPFFITFKQKELNIYGLSFRG